MPKYQINSGWDDTEYDSLSELLDNCDRDSLDILVNYGKDERSVGFNIREFDYCCGTNELGELSSDVLKYKEMDQLFNRVFEEHNNKTFVLTTIKSQGSWESYLKKSKLFKVAKRFINKNTNNQVTLWVSTN